MTTTIPCRRPKVVVSPSPENPGLYDHVCHVPGCEWTYRSVKSDHLGAPHHRHEHRAAVPTVDTIDLGAYHRVNCQCGHEHRVHGTKADVTAHVEHHLATVHGLVSC